MSKKTKVVATERSVSLVQGVERDGREFGYVAGVDGGFFFTWMPTLEETVLSMEEDWTSSNYYTQETGDGGLDFNQVAELLREHLPSTAKGRKMWAAEA